MIATIPQAIMSKNLWSESVPKKIITMYT